MGRSKNSLKGRTFKLYKSDETTILSGAFHEIAERCLLDNTKMGLKETLFFLHHEMKLNTNEIAPELNRLMGVDVFNTSGRNQEIRRLLQRVGIEKRRYNPTEKERAVFSQKGTELAQRNWENPEFISRHKERSSIRMKKMNEVDWELNRAEKLEAVKNGRNYWLENGGREEAQERARNSWADPNFRAKILTSSNRRYDTDIERIVKGILVELKVVDVKFNEYLKFPCGNFCFPDFRVGNQVIEVQGDFWHANPRKYPTDLTEVQRFNVMRDRKKKRLYTENGFNLLELWESDIHENRKAVKKGLSDFLIPKDVKSE